MNKVFVIGIGFRPLDKKASKALLQSEIVLTNDRLLEAFKDYAEYKTVKDRIISLKDIHETKQYIRPWGLVSCIKKHRISTRFIRNSTIRR